MPPSPAPRPADRRITGILLAGGQGSRMGGVDKGLVELAGRPMAAHALERLAPQVDALLINANQNLPAWQAFGHPVFGDDIGGFAGPLAGLHAGLLRAQHPFVVTAPCDSPFLPADLVERLAAALHAADAQLAVAKTFGQPHPVFCLCRRDLADHLGAFLAAGGRKIDRWYGSLKVVEVAFDDEEAAFRNVNTRDELAEAARDLPAAAAGAPRG
ncbi:molybdenum cofactor guanylyltransferase MobA [Thauera aminoaromatica]|jgi:molybdopterin-guanine dinucleotide biosynthesis protein A|uniref:Molybdenum cofactor guanylyltransferase n=1 Tax=Thauera aminoaromatica TaxID=164330 RepID=C4KCB8_THASP|nr:molybdenum cofactor guanylyltransferase MobA [Thauera aminoaromatica]MBL8462417.1 molybdenum cofactor guanylyltransferase MobA [Thauera sp.]OPZ03532.1 MAG: Molybdenum cofactor guanylyltransferase [Alphaproteobacteria bacterium ADurb.BinA305]ACR02309.1 molybdopterin-guanine dinucleotide biosynthesis protein A [Thauera aminoaromatica]TXH91521.1 MAG: molybdenum cofactor guanylyltransferase MobA [Thauera aminoaromatica]HNC68408.1 molybdenum cofactor guanylyltransferase MobA [Thauera aminoaromat